MASSDQSENPKADTQLDQMNKQFIDDLEDVHATTKVATAPQATPTSPQSTETAAPVAATPVPAPTVLLDADEEFDASVYSNSLPKLKVPTGTVARFAILGPVAEGFRHYDPQTKSYYLCISKRDGKRPVIVEKAECCKVWDEAKYCRAALILHYTGADPKTGKLSGNSWQVSALVVAGPGWGQIKGVVPEGAKVLPST
jgi:hypothetical protein